MSKVKEAFDNIPLEKRKWFEDGLYHELVYNEEFDTIEDEMTKTSGDWFDTQDVTEEYED